MIRQVSYSLYAHAIRANYVSSVENKEGQDNEAVFLIKSPFSLPFLFANPTNIDDVELLLKEIMSEARHLTQAERCSLFLLDKQHKCLVAKVFDGSSGSAQWRANEGRQFGIPADQGIAGRVADTGELLNIADAYSHPLFYHDVDKATGFKTRSVSLGTC